MRTQRTAVTLAGAVLVGALVACSGGSSDERPAGAPASASPSVTATAVLTPDAFEEVLADYDERNNAAIVGTREDGDPAAWAEADDEVLLAIDRFGTRLLDVTKDPDPPVTLTTSAVQLYAPVADGYPMVAAAVVGRERTEGAASGSDGGRGFVLWVRGSASEPWRAALSTGLPEGTSAPVAAPPGTASTPSAEDRERALAAADGVVRYLSTGKRPAGLALDDVLEGLREGTSVRSEDDVEHRLRVRYANDAEDQTSSAGSVRVVRTAEGALAFVGLLGRDTFTVGQGTFLRWDEPYGTAVGQVGPRRQLSRDVGVMVVVSLPDEGEPAVVSTTWNTTL